MNQQITSASAEWATYWYLPVVAALGYSVASLQLYGIGPFMVPLQQEFGWTRAQVMSGSVIVSLGVVLAGVPMGVLIDRLGPRRIALIGMLLVAVAIALLSTATGTIVNWLTLWAILAISAMFVQAPVWTSAVVTRFDAARGLALAITLSGASIAAFVFPLLATWLVGRFGWRGAFIGLGGIWVLAMLPLVYCFFRGAQDNELATGQAARMRPRAAADLLPGLTLQQALRKPMFYRLLLASGFFTFSILGSVVHFVPILTGSGAAPMTAAGAASLIGIFSLLGRLGTGAILDRFPAHLVGAACFLLPIPACVLLLAVDGVGTAGYFTAAALFGLTLGAEVDVITYLSARRFGLKNFGAIQGALLCAIALGAALGPFAAGSTFDHFGHYTPFMAMTIALMLISSLVIGTSGDEPMQTAPNAEAKAEADVRL